MTQIRKGQWLFPLVLLLAGILLFRAYEVTQSIRNALTLAAVRVIPALLPFMILSEYLPCCDFSIPERFGGRLFEWCFRIPRRGMASLLAGVCCGFPIGAKVAVEDYRNGYLTRGECQRLLALCSVTGPSFLVAAVGIGLFGDGTKGVFLFAVQMVAAALTGLLMRIGAPAVTPKKEPLPPPMPSPVYAVRHAAENTLYVTAFIVVFSLPQIILPDETPVLLRALFLLPFEVSNAVSAAAGLPGHTGLILASAAVGFSGLSVHLQTHLFIGDAGLSTRVFFLTKCCTALLCALLTFFTAPLFFA